MNKIIVEVSIGELLDKISILEIKQDKIKDPKNLEKVTRIFFNHRRKMLKKPFNQLFNGDQRVLNKLKIDLN